jgi:hypothetical protein
MHAMGVKQALKHMKRGLANFADNYTPIRQIKVTGMGAQRRLTDEERPMEGSGSVVIQPKRKLNPLNFRF